MTDLEIAINRICDGRARCEYRGFVLKYVMQDIVSDSLRFCARSKPKQEIVRNERGKLIDVIMHAAEDIIFDINRIEFDIENEPSSIVIMKRFTKEVDYYLDHKESEVISAIREGSLIRKYVCPCCGTDFVTDTIGFTPECKNCGARLVENAV